MAEQYKGASAEGTNSWTNPSYARGTSADASYATAAPAKNSTVNGIWKTYGFTLVSGDTVTKVEIIPRWKVNTTISIATLRIDVSWDNGTNWSTVQTDTSEPTSDTDTTFDVTSATSWDYSKLSDSNLLVRVGARRGADNDAVTFSLDRIPVRVTYTPVVYTYSLTPNSDARFKKTTDYTRTSDAQFSAVINTYSFTSNSDTKFKYEQIYTRPSDARFKTSISYNRNSDAIFRITNTLWSQSDARFRATIPIYPTSDARFYSSYIYNRNSDARFRTTFAPTINSDSRFRTTVPISKFSDASFEGTGQFTKTSDAIFDIAFAGGDGTSGTPWQIVNVYQLQHMKEHRSSYFILMNDIDAADTSTWNSGAGFVPIGDATTPFSGGFNGDGKSITSLFIDRDATDNIGLFGRVTGTVEKVEMFGTDITGYDSVGGLVGFADTGSIIRYSKSLGAIDGHNNIGGLIGKCSGTCYDCYSHATANGNSYIAGLIGYISSSDIDRCYSTGVVTGTSNKGGLIAYSATSTVIDCYWDITTSGQSSSAGGIGKYTADMMKIDTFAPEWDISYM